MGYRSYIHDTYEYTCNVNPIRVLCVILFYNLFLFFIEVKVYNVCYSIFRLATTNIVYTILTAVNE